MIGPGRQTPVKSIPSLSSRSPSHPPILTTLAPEVPRGLDRGPIDTQLMVNISQPEALVSLADLPVDGIGLLRSELLAIALLTNTPIPGCKKVATRTLSMSCQKVSFDLRRL